MLTSLFIYTRPHEVIRKFTPGNKQFPSQYFVSRGDSLLCSALVGNSFYIIKDCDTIFLMSEAENTNYSHSLEKTIPHILSTPSRYMLYTLKVQIKQLQFIQRMVLHKIAYSINLVTKFLCLITRFMLDAFYKQI